jgi:hypothetical protein
MIYEFITPSDPITFKADDDKIAIAVSLLLGNGKAGCRKEDGESLPTMYLFHSDPLPEIEKSLGESLETFIDSNKDAIATAFDSFAYGSIEDRKQYDDATEAITDPAKLEEFKSKHEDRHRSSMSQWVQMAWKYGKAMRAKIAEA